MDYPKFMELSAEIKVQIIKKCYPIPYVRLRRSCRHLDELSEQNRKNLGIYCYRREPHLYLTNSLWISPFFNSNRSHDIIGPHIVVNYGKKAYDHNFLVPMTRRNISRIRSSLSGFYFFEITLLNSAMSEDYESKKQFDDAMKYLLEMACDLNFRYVTARCLTTDQLEIVLREWNTKGITIIYYRGANAQILKEFAQMDVIKKMPYADYTVFLNHEVTSSHIENFAQGKETLYLTIHGLSHQIAIESYNNLQMAWAKNGNFPRLFYIQFYHDLSVFDSSTGYNILHSTHINHFVDLEHNFTEISYYKKKYNIWLLEERGKRTWRIVSCRRVKHHSQTQIQLCLRTGLSMETLIQRLFFYVNICYPGHALDYSTVYEKLKNAETVEEIKEEYRKLTEEMLRFYKKTYRRSILNVLCEMMTEWWNWPRWILEFTKRRPIEKRPPIVDLGYVLFQEILCPIYQYSTMPY